MKSLKNMTGAELEELYNSPIKERAALMNKGDDDRLVARMEKLLLDGRIEAEQGRRSNRAMLWIAVVSLIVTGATGLATLILQLVRG